MPIRARHSLLFCWIPLPAAALERQYAKRLHVRPDFGKSARSPATPGRQRASSSGSGPSSSQKAPKSKGVVTVKARVVQQKAPRPVVLAHVPSSHHSQPSAADLACSRALFPGTAHPVSVPSPTHRDALAAPAAVAGSVANPTSVTAVPVSSNITICTHPDCRHDESDPLFVAVARICSAMALASDWMTWTIPSLISAIECTINAVLAEGVDDGSLILVPDAWRLTCLCNGQHLTHLYPAYKYETDTIATLTADPKFRLRVRALLIWFCAPAVTIPADQFSRTVHGMCRGV